MHHYHYHWHCAETGKPAGKRGSGELAVWRHSLLDLGSSRGRKTRRPPGETGLTALSRTRHSPRTSTDYALARGVCLACGRAPVCTGHNPQAHARPRASRKSKYNKTRTLPLYPQSALLCRRLVRQRVELGGQLARHRGPERPALQEGALAKEARDGRVVARGAPRRLARRAGRSRRCGHN